MTDHAISFFKRLVLFQVKQPFVVSGVRLMAPRAIGPFRGDASVGLGKLLVVARLVATGANRATRRSQEPSFIRAVRLMTGAALALKGGLMNERALLLHRDAQINVARQTQLLHGPRKGKLDFPSVRQMAQVAFSVNHGFMTEFHGFYVLFDDGMTLITKGRAFREKLASVVAGVRIVATEAFAVARDRVSALGVYAPQYRIVAFKTEFLLLCRDKFRLG